MFQLRKPSQSAIAQYLEIQSQLSFTYAEVGATITTPPPGYVVDHTRTQIGIGDAAFQRGKEAIRGWKQFDLGWLTAWPHSTPIEQGAAVVVLIRTLGLWCLSAARIVYVINEPRRFGFAYGTLPGHVERGEERFLIELADGGAVWYDVLAFSRPRHPLTQIGHPYVRRLQKRFGRDSAAAMRCAVEAQ